MTGKTLIELSTAPMLQDADAIYRRLVEAHRGLTPEQSAALNSALVLILANQTGSDATVRAAIDMAVAALDLPRT